MGRVDLMVVLAGMAHEKAGSRGVDGTMVNILDADNDGKGMVRIVQLGRGRTIKSSK